MMNRGIEGGGSRWQQGVGGRSDALAQCLQVQHGLSSVARAGGSEGAGVAALLGQQPLRQQRVVHCSVVKDVQEGSPAWPTV